MPTPLHFTNASFSVQRRMKSTARSSSLAEAAQEKVDQAMMTEGYLTVME